MLQPLLRLRPLCSNLRSADLLGMLSFAQGVCRTILKTIGNLGLVEVRVVTDEATSREYFLTSERKSTGLTGVRW